MKGQHWLYSVSMATSIALMLIPTHRALAQGADVSIELVEGTARARSGGQVSYTWRVTNHGPGPAYDVWVAASPSEQLEITGNSCGNPPNPMNCGGFGLFPGTSMDITFEGVVCCYRSGSSRDASLSVRVSHEYVDWDPDPGNNTATTMTRISGPARD